MPGVSILALVDRSKHGYFPPMYQHMMYDFYFPLTCHFVLYAFVSLLYMICICKSAAYDMTILLCFFGIGFMKISSNCQVPFLICSQKYCSVVIQVLCICLVFHIINLSVFVTLPM